MQGGYGVDGGGGGGFNEWYNSSAREYGWDLFKNDLKSKSEIIYCVPSTGFPG